MQQDQEGARQQEFELLRMHLAQMNILLDQLIKVGESGSTVAATKKTIPFQTGSQSVGQLNQQPANPDLYPTSIDVYSINNSRIIPKMTFRLIEGIIRTGSFAPQTKANVEIRPTLQANEEQLLFDAIFDNAVPTITITSPTVQTLPAIYGRPGFHPPLPPGATATFTDVATGAPMPYLIRTGHIAESFAWFGNTSTDCTIRVWAEPVPNSASIFGSTTFVLFSVLPFSNRGTPFNFVPNINFYSTQFFDPNGAPPPGRFVLFTITNDDPFNNMIGDPFIVAILRQLS